VQESFFRYPGPRPRSRETGIVMLADTIEAASRTLSSPSAARLQAFVHELVMEKVLDGQLDECELTFADLSAIEDSFVRVLVTRFHSRVRYPGQQPEEKQAEYTGKTTVVEPIGPETPKPAACPADRPCRGAPRINDRNTLPGAPQERNGRMTNGLFTRKDAKTGLLE